MKYYSKKLSMYYTITETGSVVFEDGTEYTKHEMSVIQGLNNDDINTIHNIKKVFSGEVQ